MFKVQFPGMFKVQFVLLLLSVGDVMVRSWNMKRFVGTALTVVSIQSLPEGVYAGTADVFQAATRAMTSEDKKDKAQRIKSFDELNPSAKKRYALDRCKDQGARRSARFASVSECNSAVLSGDYASIVGGRDQDPKIVYDSKQDDKAAVVKMVEQKSAKIVESSESSRQQASFAKPVKPVVAVEKEKRRQKTQDLSGLSSAAIRRRAIAACKNSDIRKEAGMKSESFCTERAMNNDYAAIVEVLEYK